MSLIVEDGSGVAGAESYGSVAEADAYHASLGNTAWAAIASSGAKEILLRQAARYMEQRFRPRWQGWRATTTQAMDWPRLGVFLTDVAAVATGGHLSSFAYMIAANAMPVQLKEAQFELALIANDGPLTPALTQRKSQLKVGPIFIQYDSRSPQTTRHPQIALILATLLKDSSGMMRLER